MVTTSSALSSSSEPRIRSSNARSAAYSGWFAAFFSAAFLETGFFVESFLVAGFAATLDFAGAFLAPVVLRVSVHPPSRPDGGTVRAIYHAGMTPTKPSAKVRDARIAVALCALRLPSMTAIAGGRRAHNAGPSRAWPKRRIGLA